jgi:hypothetical protein
MREMIQRILQAHNAIDEFNCSIREKIYFEMEIIPSEEGTSFSRPLSIISTGNNVILSHYTISTYDVDYNPLIEFRVEGDTWIPLSIFRFFSGLRVVGETINMDEILEICKEWEKDLETFGYLDPSQGKPNSKFHSNL